MNPSKLKLLFITVDPDIACYVLSQGIDRIFIDLEIMGKTDRQGHLDTVISRHNFEDISALRPLLPSGALLVRLNPIHQGTEDEVDDAIRRGADTLMLPMFRTPADVRRFCIAVNSRARVCLLVETIDAMNNLSECLQIPGVNEVHIGLNDLHLEMGCRFMFEPLASGHVDRMATVIRNAGIPFGIGGVARAGEGMLPAELVLAEHARLGSTGAIISRTFHRQAGSVQEIQARMDFGAELLKLRQAYQTHRSRTPEELASLHSEVQAVTAQIASKLPERRSLVGRVV
jgi:hypothetical protein